MSKEGYTSCEITTGVEDEHLLQQIKGKLGGSIKLRSGANEIRYRLHNRKGMETLVELINGEIRYKNRKEQLKRVCEELDVIYKEPEELKRNSG